MKEYGLCQQSNEQPLKFDQAIGIWKQKSQLFKTNLNF